MGGGRGAWGDLVTRQQEFLFLDMVEARSVNVKHTHTHTRLIRGFRNKYH